MGKIIIEEIRDGNIEPCRDLCNALMAHQMDVAVMLKENFASMNFDTRMKVSFENAERSQVITAQDPESGEYVGYVFSTIEDVREESRHAKPPWAPEGDDILGFYPEWLELPAKIAKLNNLYVLPEYRGTGLGDRLTAASLEWMKSADDVDIAFVYVSNGNEGVLDFYMKHGFTLSHEVFGGFIHAAYMRIR